MDIAPWALAAAVAAAFLISATWYAVLDRPATGGEASTGAAMPIWKVGAELGRGLVVALVIAWLATRLQITEWRAAVLLGLVLWAGFPLVLITGSVLWDDAPKRRAVLHAGDWLLKLVAVALITALWR
ncbi:hypothetical protein Sru01_45170 [Sphaerisporangium rufum]|uniref:DUF1761 domain-containing protein n=1 Tax=Sphaerisporangium rufum TaxID=1381558 RepID=A0A919R902_9ACTN|nr:DUF1761 domain-containing protein [Sphaerisporangium rufum]GII79535.1 hypothetical protein Sru01_45170 [Sphaerisporangium rufum]